MVSVTCARGTSAAGLCSSSHWCLKVPFTGALVEKPPGVETVCESQTSVRLQLCAQQMTDPSGMPRAVRAASSGRRWPAPPLGLALLVSHQAGTWNPLLSGLAQNDPPPGTAWSPACPRPSCGKSASPQL